MVALQVLEATVWRDSLAAIPEVQALVTWEGVTPVQYKIFWEHVKAGVAMPYITTNHMMGSRLKDHAYSDTTWKIVGHTGDMDTAVALADAISKLDKSDPVTTAYPGVCGVTYIEETLPIFDRYQVQNNPLFVVGAMYRIRLYLGTY